MWTDGQVTFSNSSSGLVSAGNLGPAQVQAANRFLPCRDHVTVTISSQWERYICELLRTFRSLPSFDPPPTQKISLVARAQARLCPGAVCICSSYVIHVIINVIVSTVYIYVYIYIYQQITCITVCMQIDIEYKLKKKLVNLTQNN